MVIFKYYNFLIFIVLQKQLKKSGESEAKASTVLFITFLQLITAFAVFTEFLPDFKGITRTLIYGLGIILFAVNYYYYVKKDKLNAIKAQFENSDFNTKRNNVIGTIIILFFLIWPIILISVSSYLKTKQ